MKDFAILILILGVFLAAIGLWARHKAHFANCDRHGD